MKSSPHAPVWHTGDELSRIGQLLDPVFRLARLRMILAQRIELNGGSPPDGPSSTEKPCVIGTLGLCFGLNTWILRSVRSFIHTFDPVLIHRNLR